MKLSPPVAFAFLALLFVPAMALAAPNFGAKTDFATGTNPTYTSVGDLNADGKPDLVVANSTAHSLSVLLGNGNGTFGPKTDITTSGAPNLVAIGDLNGDGKPDLAIANNSPNYVTVMLGNGNGTFGAGTNYPTGNYPSSLAIGDLNGDGKPDLAVANFYSQSVSLFFGNGNGTFGPKTDLDVSYMPVSVVIADLDANGTADLAVSNRGSNTVSVILGTGNGTFSYYVDYPAGDYPGFMAVGDVNSDGTPDFVVPNSNGNNVSVLLGNGVGGFGAKTDFGTGGFPWAAALGDLDGDGKLDIAVANGSSNTVSVLPGNGNGTFEPKTDFPTGNTPQAVAVADLNGDGRRDLVVPNFASNSVSVLLCQSAPTVTVLGSAPNPSTVGQGVTLTATVTPAGATGSVTFRDGPDSLGVATLGGGVATLTVPGLCGGSHSLSATYTGDPGHSASTSTAVGHVVNPAATTVAVVSSVTPSHPGEAVHFTATVSHAAVSACAFTGTVQFVIDGTPFGAPVALTGGTAISGDISSLAVGTHSVLATYSGNASFQGSTSPAITQAVVLNPSSTLLGSSPNPSHTGDLVTITATVTPASAAGSVTFRDGPDSIGTATLRTGVATMTTATLAVGDHSLTAAYGGDNALGASVSPVSVHTVLPILATTIALTSDPAPSAVGQAVLLTATVSPAGASGSVEFRNGGTPIGTGVVSGGVATLSVPGLCGGTWSLTAVYGGDPGHYGSTSPALEHVVDPAPTTLAVVSSIDPSHVGEAVSFTATLSHSAVTSCALGGSVQFVIDGASFGAPVALSGASATLAGVTTLAAGPHSVHATYSGNTSFLGSTSPAITQTVQLNPSATSLGSSPNPSHIGDLVTLTAAVTPAGATGHVTFRDGPDSIGTATLNGGVATMTTATLAVGDHSLTAEYAGDESFGASVSPASAHTVLPVAWTSIALVAAPAPSVAGQAVLLTATVSPAGASGSVEFREGGSPIGTGVLNGGVATLSVPGFCGGTWSFTAVYAGDPGYAGSTSPALEHVVNPAPTTLAVVSSPNPSRLAQAVSFTASVAHAAGGACALTGAIQFVIDGAAFGAPVPLSGGSATLGGVTTLAAGPHSVYAVYPGSASFEACTSAVITQEIESPKPSFVGVRDVPNDQGGRVRLLWNASYLDLAPYSSIESYWVMRSVPPAVAARAIAAGAHVSRPGEAAAPRAGAFLAVELQGATYFWEFLASQPAFHVQNYSYVAATTRDSVAGSNPPTAFMLLARTAAGAESWASSPDSGYSVDNLAPQAPGHFTGTFTSGVAKLHWARNPEADLGEYRLHRGATANFVPGPGNLVVAQPDTGYVDAAAGTLSYYKLCAVDVHGNASGFTALLPIVTAGVGDEGPLAFALEGVRPNPSRGENLSVSFTLPVPAYARIELVDVTGRRVAEREVGVLGAGRHSVSLAAERRLAPGLYLVRLTQGVNMQVKRVVVLK